MTPVPQVLIVAPAAGTVLTQPRLHIAVVVSGTGEGELQVLLDGKEISARVGTPFRRMRSLGGQAVAVGSMDLEDLEVAAGERRITASWLGAATVSTTSRFIYRPATGRLQVVVHAGGKPSPARLFLDGMGATPQPDFSTPGMEDVDPRPRHGRIDLIDSASGRETLVLAPGRYRVMASRGIEYSVDQAEVQVEAGKTAELHLDLEHVAPTPGWISADLHVHAAPSFDSFLPLDERVRGYLAAGVEVLVATDHHMLTDYAPAIATLPGAAEHITSLVGVETGLRPNQGGTAGHWNLFPFNRDGTMIRPWPLSWAREPAELYRLFRDGGDEPPAPPGVQAADEGLPPEGRAVGRAGGIIEVNHPRGLTVETGGRVRGAEAAAWFTDEGFDPGSPLAAPGDAAVAGANAFLSRRDSSGRHAAIDFDALEILNRFSVELYREVRQDWFALLAAGHRPTGTANSDSHHHTLVGPGFPRNLVRLEPAHPAGLDGDAFTAALRAGAVVGTTGPLLDLTVQGISGKGVSVTAAAIPGETLAAPAGKVRVTLEVRAAPWVPVREVRLYRGTEIIRRLVPPPGVQVLRLVLAEDISITGDTWILAEAGDPEAGSALDPGAIYRRLAPGFAPLAFTNPVFIDAEGDGWRPQLP